MADWMEELERLAELRDKGLITDEEFEVKRQEIINVSSKDETPDEEPQEVEEVVEETPEPDESVSSPSAESANLSEKIRAKAGLIFFLLLIAGIIVGVVVSQGGDSSTSTSSGTASGNTSATQPTPTPERVPISDSCLASTDKRFQETANVMGRATERINTAWVNLMNAQNTENEERYFNEAIEIIDRERQAFIDAIWQWEAGRTAKVDGGLKYCDDYINSLVTNTIKDSEKPQEALDEINQFNPQEASDPSSEYQLLWSKYFDQLENFGDSLCILGAELGIQINSFMKEQSSLC